MVAVVVIISMIMLMMEIINGKHGVQILKTQKTLDFVVLFPAFTSTYLFQRRLGNLDRLAGLVFTASSSIVEDPGFESRSSRDFSGVVIPVT